MKNLFFLLSICFSFNSYAQYLLGNTSLDTTEVFSSLNEPWEILYGSDSTLWVTEKQGLVSRINPSNSQRSVILDIRNKVWQVGESGLLGMCFSLNYLTDSKVFFAYTYSNGTNHFLRVVHYMYDSSQDSLLNEFVVIDSLPANTYHNGCRLLFLNDGSLLISTGDAGNTALSQNRNSLAGKFLRVMPSGAFPTNNPFPNSPVYTSGHRNAQGLFLFNNKVYSSEHGPANDDEINVIKTGGNYGWPNVEGFCDKTNEVQFCNDSNVVEPIFAWTPTVATSDIVIYNHAAIPEWRNTLLLTTLKNQSIIALTLNTSGDSVIASQTHFKNEWGRLRDICIGNRGEIYIISNGFSRNGDQGRHKIIKIENLNFTSLKEEKTKLQLNIYPNPAYDSITIENYNRLGSVKIYSINGALKGEFNLSDTNSIDIRQFDSGIYLLEYSIENRKVQKMKFLKL